MSGYAGGSTGGGGTETTTTLGALISGATSKATPVDADNVCITDSAASHITKKLTWANLKATLKTYFFGGSTNGGVLFIASELPVEDDATFLYDNTDKTLKLLESAYNVATSGWSSASKAALQIGNNNTPHTFGSDPGFFGQKIDIYGAASSGNSKQLSGIRVRAQFAATGTSNGHTTTAIEAFVSNPDDTTANANALLQALEGIVQPTQSIGRAAAGYFVVNAGGAANPTVTTQYGVFSQIGNAGAFSTTDAALFHGWAVTGSGVVTNLYGLRLAGWSGTGVVNSYGIYIEASIDLGTTLKYAFYSLSTSPSLFSGPVSGVINAYDATSWNGSAKFATEDAVRDEIEAVKATIGGGGYSDEAAQDAVGSILVDSAEIDFTYSDATPSITASIVAGSIDETKLDASVNASLAGELTANTQTGTTYSLVVGDKGKEVRTTNAAAKTVTVDPTSGLTTGFVCIVGNYGAGALTIAPGSGVTLRGYLWKVPQYGKAAIRAIGTDEFIVDILPNEAMVTLTDGATVTIDPKLGKRHYLSTANSRTIANGTAGLYDGQPLTVKILNSSGGSVTPTFDTGASNKFRFNGTLTVASAIAAGKTRYWTCSYNTADTRWDILAESGEF